MPWHESVIESELAKTKVLVNASSVGRDPGETPIPAELLPPDLMVLDLLYSPKETRLLREAKSAGASAVMNGDLMLLHQSAAAFELWTGLKAPMDLLTERLDAARDASGNPDTQPEPQVPQVAPEAAPEPESSAKPEPQPVAAGDAAGA